MSSTSAQGHNSRYSTGGGYANAHRKIEQQLRNVQLDKRLNELKQAQNSHLQQSSMIMDKYSNRHQNDQNRVINSTINKSGQNLTSNLTRVLHQKNTVSSAQRSQLTTASNGRNTAKPQIITG